VIWAMVMMPIALVMTSAVELSLISKEKSHLQAAVDAGALAGATELSLASRGTEGVVETATGVAKQAFANSQLPATFSVDVDRAKGEVLVTGRVARKSMMGIGGIGDANLVASATAESLQSIPLCILQTNSAAQAKKMPSGFRVEDRASIVAPGCLVQANENIVVAPEGRIEATRVQAVGTATGTIMPMGNSGALAIQDPFTSMDLTPPTACAGKTKGTTRQVAKDESLTLAPGIHCEKFKVHKNGLLVLSPGEHYFEDDLDMKGDSILKGEDVVLIFGSTKKFDFGENTRVDLAARRTGRFAGFLIATDRTNVQPFAISSNYVRELLGTIYIPNAELIISATAPVADQSDWSVIVARAITLKNNPKLVINTSYVASGVPVPEGVGPSNGAPRLTK
jgi:Putative Flp pilus-assembly TadE/G-like